MRQTLPDTPINVNGKKGRESNRLSVARIILCYSRPNTPPLGLVPFTFSVSRSVDPTMRIALYCRVSTRDQSCDLQVRDLRAYCAARKFTIFREYIDVGESGAKNSRPELNNLMADARKRTLDRKS